MISFALFATWATLGLHTADNYWAKRPNPCPHIYVAAIVAGGAPLGGNFKDEVGDCIIWLNTDDGPYSKRDICKIIVHEEGHLRGLQHSLNKKSVMYSPFQSKPTPRGCRGR